MFNNKTKYIKKCICTLSFMLHRLACVINFQCESNYSKDYIIILLLLLLLLLFYYASSRFDLRETWVNMKKSPQTASSSAVPVG